LLALALGLAGAGRAGAAPLPRDPVEDFRRALEQAMLQDPRSLRYNQARIVKDLEDKAAAVVSLADLGRALLLLEWSQFPKDPKLARITPRIRRRMANRFIAGVKAAAEGTNADRQIAACNLVGETITAAGDLDERVGGPVSERRTGDLELYQTLVKVADPLIQLSKTKNPRVREAVARALSQFSKSPEVVPALGNLLDRADPANDLATRRAAAEAMTTLALILTGGETLRSSEPGVMRRDTRYSKALFGHEDYAKIGARVVTAATRGLTDPSPAVRRASSAALRQVGATGVYFGLQPLPRKDDPTRRPASVEETKEFIASLGAVLGEFGKESKQIARSSIDSDPEVRLETRRLVEALGRVRTIVHELEALVKDASAEEKQREKDKDKDKGPDKDKGDDLASARPTHLPAVRGVLVRRQKAKPADPVKELLDATARVLIQRGFRDPNPAARRAAFEALESLDDLAQPYIGLLAGGLQDPDLFVRWIAARALMRLAYFATPEQAKVAVAGLTRQLFDSELDPRIAAAYALAAFGPAARSAVPALAKVVNRGDAEFRVAAMRALEHIGTDSVPALPELVKAFSETDPRVRSEAARIVGRFGKAAAPYAKDLRALIADPDSEVRRAASAAILNVTRGK
jgi:HEAT repeat protein